MTPMGTNLFTQGLSVSESIQEHPPQQSFGSDYENLTATNLVKSTMQVNCLYCQEGADPAWMAPGHPPLICFIDFFMPGMVPRSNDVLNANRDLEQTVVVRNLRVSSKSINAADAQGVSYSISFNGGKIVRLANSTMDLP